MPRRTSSKTRVIPGVSDARNLQTCEPCCHLARWLMGSMSGMRGRNEITMSKREGSKKHITPAGPYVCLLYTAVPSLSKQTYQQCPASLKRRRVLQGQTSDWVKQQQPPIKRRVLEASQWEHITQANDLCEPCNMVWQGVIKPGADDQP